VETRYYHTDGLGSIVAVSDEFGRIEKRVTYDPWGQRDMPLDTHTGEGGGITRGFTNHEHLYDFGLIHMNGRVFDPVLARFLSADSYVQDVGNSQCHNRYSYCVNNPLNHIDPGGEVWWPIIVGAILGAYTGGRLANKGESNPGRWDFGSSQTWRYMVYGAIVGAVSGYVGAEIAASGMPMANTAGTAYGSLIFSMGTSAYTNGQTPLSVHLGVASYNFSNRKWRYLGQAGNEWYQDVGYGIGALNNAADLAFLTSGAFGTTPNSVPNSSGMSRDEAAAYAGHSYNMGTTAPPGASVHNVFSKSSHGTNAVLFKNDATGALVLTFRGTSSLGDWVDNLINAFGFRSSRYSAAIKVTNEVIMNNPGANITLVGHSLGGGQAALASVRTERPAITFNAAGVNPLNYGLSVGSYYNQITNYYVPWEPLTFFQRITPFANALGRQIRQHPSLGPSYINIYNHGISTYLPAVP
jgi:RHS repeat-associated protein